jgi:hypothetical protein
MADYLTFKKAFLADGGAADKVDQRWDESTASQQSRTEEARLRVDELKLTVELKKLEVTQQNNAMLMAVAATTTTSSSSKGDSSSELSTSDDDGDRAKTPAERKAAKKAHKASKAARKAAKALKKADAAAEKEKATPDPEEAQLAELKKDRNYETRKLSLLRVVLHKSKGLARSSPSYFSTLSPYVHLQLGERAVQSDVIAGGGYVVQLTVTRFCCCCFILLFFVVVSFLFWYAVQLHVTTPFRVAYTNSYFISLCNVTLH